MKEEIKTIVGPVLKATFMNDHLFITTTHKSAQVIFGSIYTA